MESRHVRALFFKSWQNSALTWSRMKFVKKKKLEIIDQKSSKLWWFWWKMKFLVPARKWSKVLWTAHYRAENEETKTSKKWKNTFSVPSVEYGLRTKWLLPGAQNETRSVFFSQNQSIYQKNFYNKLKKFFWFYNLL